MPRTSGTSEFTKVAGCSGVNASFRAYDSPEAIRHGLRAPAEGQCALCRRALGTGSDANASHKAWPVAATPPTRIMLPS